MRSPSGHSRAGAPGPLYSSGFKLDMSRLGHLERVIVSQEFSLRDRPLLLLLCFPTGPEHLGRWVKAVMKFLGRFICLGKITRTRCWSRMKKSEKKAFGYTVR